MHFKSEKPKSAFTTQYLLRPEYKCCNVHHNSGHILWSVGCTHKELLLCWV